MSSTKIKKVVFKQSHSLVLGLEGSECINVHKFSYIKQTFRKQHQSICHIDTVLFLTAA